MPSCFIHTGRAIWVYHSCQCANIICIFNSSSYSNHYCFRSYIIPLAILVNRLVIFGRYCIIRLLQLNALPICLALNRLNKFNNIFHQFSNSVSFGFPRDGDIIANVEIALWSGENVEWQGVGVSLCPPSNIDSSRKSPFIYRSNTPSSNEKGVSCSLGSSGR